MEISKIKIERAAAPVRKVVEKGLREAIIRGDLAPGAHLVDRELCSMFDVSRTVVREAQRSLEAEGLVEIIPHRGVFVRRISYDEAQQIYDVRKVLEALAGQKCAMNATETDIAELEAVCEQLRASIDNPLGVDLLAVKTRFYDVLMRAAHNRMVEKMLGQILNYNTQLRATSLSEPGRLPRTVEELDRIVDAIRAHDSAGAWDACFTHVENAARAALRVLKEQNERDEAARRK